LVRDNVDQALRVLKKKMQREGVFREMKQRRFDEKPSERTTREKAEANFASLARNGFDGGRDEGPKRPAQNQYAVSATKREEISPIGGLPGGPERTRTTCQPRSHIELVSAKARTAKLVGLEPVSGSTT
jgi:ribosomal protein S21